MASFEAPQAATTDATATVLAGADPGTRLVRPDGTFNVSRAGLGWRRLLSPYENLLVMSWPRFIGVVLLLYFGGNLLFAIAYWLCGPDGLTGGTNLPELARAFFFSVTTTSTVGYGHISPVSVASHVVMTVETVMGLVGLALISGVAFARFARPLARVEFSRRAVIGPHRGGLAFMVRLANVHRSQLLDVQARVIFSSRARGVDGRSARRFHALPLERDHVLFFPMSLTLVHAVDRESPLYGLEPGDLAAAEAEFIVLLTGVDEATSQSVHARTSYVASDVVWGARFAPFATRRSADGRLRVDVRRIHDLEPAPAARG